uniref:Monoglyceride lipase n=1 Tax=Gadus morhua TaxID=8049 RepID=A0A8C5FJW0_GADMO
MPEPGDPRKTPQGVPYADLKHIVNADGLHLFCRYWEPEAQPRALVYVAHGAGEHSGPYDEIALRLKELSLLVFAHDHVGHGQSEGDRMIIKDFQVYVRDSLQHIDLMKAQHPSLPVFILGHSMGGAISILTASERANDFAGVVLISPLVQMNPDSATPFKLKHNASVDSYNMTPLNYHGGLRVSFAMQLMGAVERIQRVIPAIAWPFLLLQGDTDNADKKLKVQEGAILHPLASKKKKSLPLEPYHALHHELPEVSESVLKELTSWFNRATVHLPNKNPRLHPLYPASARQSPLGSTHCTQPQLYKAPRLHPLYPASAPTKPPRLHPLYPASALQSPLGSTHCTQPQPDKAP